MSGLRIAKKKKGKYSTGYAKYLWKNEERKMGDFALTHDDEDPFFSSMQSKRGRVGQYNHLRIDVITKNWVWESKKMEKSFNKKFTEAVINIIEQGVNRDKFPVIRLDIQEPIRDNLADLKRLPPLMVIPEAVFGLLLDMIPPQEEEVIE